MDETKINIPQQVAPVQSYARVLSTFEKVKDVLSSVALLSGIAYGIYVFYKVSRKMNFDRVFFNLILIQKYIEPFLFGRKKKGDKIDELARTTKAINGELIRVREEINNQKQIQDSSNKLLQSTLQTFKNEIETIKGILLNHKNFSTPSTSSNISHMQKIPSWQLSSKKTSTDDDKHDDVDKHSNSSENDTEVIHEPQQKRSPANSDSSLEIM